MPEAPAVKLAGARTHIVVPLLKADEVIGAIIIYRQEVQPFTDKQIELVQNFARSSCYRHREPAPAERTISAIGSACQQQTATSEVLQGHKQFTRRAGARVPGHAGECDAHLRGQVRSSMYRSMKEGALRIVAMHNARPPSFAEERRRRNPLISPGCGRLGRALATKQNGYIADVQDEPSNVNAPVRLDGRAARAGAGRRTDRGCRSDAQEKASWSAPLYIYRTGGPPVHRQADRASNKLRRGRPSSRSRTPACSTSCASARTISPSRWSSRRRHRRCCKSSAAPPRDELEPVFNTVLQNGQRRNCATPSWLHGASRTRHASARTKPRSRCAVGTPPAPICLV